MASDLQVTTAPFWSNFRRVQRSRFPFHSDFIDSVEDHYRFERRKFVRKNRSHLLQVLPPSTIHFYDGILKKARRAALSSLRKSNLTQFARNNLDRSFGIELGADSTVQRVLDLDVFSQVTVAMDIEPSLLLGGINRSVLAKNKKLYENTLHLILHRPQQSEFMVFHEMVVGFLVYRAMGRSRVPKRLNWNQIHSDYWATSAHTLMRLSEYLDVEVDELVRLHFEDAATVRRFFPRQIQDLLLVANNVFWYQEFTNLYYRAQSASTTLAEVNVFWIQAALGRMERNPKLKLRRGADAVIDQRVQDEVILYYKKGAHSFGDADSSVFMAKLVECLWR